MEEKKVTNQTDKDAKEEYEILKKLNEKLPYFSKSPKNNSKKHSDNIER